MSKSIKVSQQDIERLKDEFMKQLLSGKWENGKVNFQGTLGVIDRKARVCFSDLAWRKMQALIAGFDLEVGWHGIARRGEDETKDEYYIDDILVYPQEVTDMTVTTDEKEYQDWLLGQEDDVFNNIRFQGHSHVNMGTSPSNVDWELYRGILNQLDDSMFYIFMIWNKKGDKTVLLYDMKKNILFETADVIIDVEDEWGFNKFIDEAKELVRKKAVYNYPTTYQGFGKSSSTQSANKNNKQENKRSASFKSFYSGWDDDWDDEYTYYGYGRRANYK